MIIFANAKINLGLFILSKRADGYHSISSVKYPIPLYDVIEILPSESFELTILGKEIAGELYDNLIWKAYHLLQKYHGIGPVRILLQKNIPMGAGLGGGSSNATFVLKGLNDYFKLGLSKDTLKSYASTLGSDCAFFVENVPQLATEKGEVLSPVEVNLKGKYLYLVHPDLHIGTAEAYALVRPKPTDFDWNRLVECRFSEWKAHLKNDFEASIFPVHPNLAELKDAFYAHGALYAAMSGSGSSVFGLFAEKPARMENKYASTFILEL